MIYWLMDLVDYFQLKILGIPGIGDGIRDEIGDRIRIRIRDRIRDGIRDEIRDGEWRIRVFEVQKFWSNKIIKTGIIILTEYSYD